MYTDSLPYRLEALAFPYPALALLAGRLPLGGGREVALAALMTARLAATVDGPAALPPAERATRAAAAKVWLASLALPASTRVAFARCIEATTGSAQQTAGALRTLLAAASAHLDGAGVNELERLATTLNG